jgi:hypothetical protein
VVGEDVDVLPVMDEQWMKGLASCQRWARGDDVGMAREILDAA